MSTHTDDTHIHGGTTVHIKSPWDKILTGAILSLLVAAIIGAIDVRDAVRDNTSHLIDLERRVAQKASNQSLQALETLNAQRYNEILRRLDRIERTQDEGEQ